jgi:hypothetical protein
VTSDQQAQRPAGSPALGDGWLALYFVDKGGNEPELREIKIVPQADQPLLIAKEASENYVAAPREQTAPLSARLLRASLRPGAAVAYAGLRVETVDAAQMRRAFGVTLDDLGDTG